MDTNNMNVQGGNLGNQQPNYNAPQQPNYGTPQQPDYGANYGTPMNQAPNGVEPGKGQAVGSLVCGIISMVFWFTGNFAVIGVILGIVGLILSSLAKKAGNNTGVRTAGFVCSLIGLIGDAIIFIACVACVGALGSLGAAGLADIF